MGVGSVTATHEVVPAALTLGDLRRFEQPMQVTLSDAGRANIRRSHQVLAGLLGRGERIYGVNTGFGPLSDQMIDGASLQELQRRLVLSNAGGVGEPLAPHIVRRVMLLKLATLAAGASGVREDLADAIVAMLNADIVPVMPSKGSVGASGDLAPLAHLGAALIGVGDVFHEGERCSAIAAFRRVGREPLVLGPKEGLAIVNGTQVSTALAVEGLFRTEEVLAAAFVAGALSVEAGSGTAAPFDERLQHLKGQRGQQRAGRVLRQLLADSLLQADRPVKRVQDPYCLRCQPQVMGAVIDQIDHAAAIIEREINGVSDNPLIDSESGQVLYGGNFHAQAVGLAADNMALAIAEIGSMSERRTAFLVDAHVSGLPAFLVADGGLNSGFMVAQVTAAALASENKSLAHPASIDSIPTAANLEDYVSMATFAARRLGDMAANARSIVAIELLAAAQGLDLRRPLQTSAPLEGVVRQLRSRVEPWIDDRFLAPDIEAADRLIASGAYLACIDPQIIPSLRSS
jgi:histidine ammonia-lyase